MSWPPSQTAGLRPGMIIDVPNPSPSPAVKDMDSRSTNSVKPDEAARECSTVAEEDEETASETHEPITPTSIDGHQPIFPLEEHGSAVKGLVSNPAIISTAATP